jgi:hypothetical protein
LAELNVHSRKYSDSSIGFSRNHKAAVKLALCGKLPSSAFFLLSDYEPCRCDCNSFTSQSKKMEGALAEYLPDELEKILAGYKKETSELK